MRARWSGLRRHFGTGLSTSGHCCNAMCRKPATSSAIFSSSASVARRSRSRAFAGIAFPAAGSYGALLTAMRVPLAMVAPTGFATWGATPAVPSAGHCPQDSSHPSHLPFPGMDLSRRARLGSNPCFSHDHVFARNLT